MHDVVLTLIGPDRPGLVEAVAVVIAHHGGNWLESRMTRLAGQFAGILRAELPAENVQAALAALAALGDRGLKVITESTARAPAAAATRRRMTIEVVGLDRPGIVREISQLLAQCGVNVDDLVTDRVSAPMSGETLFEATADVHVPASTDLPTLRKELERIAGHLMVDLKFDESPTRRV